MKDWSYDWVLFVSVLLILGAGLLSLYGISSAEGSTNYFLKQLLFAGVGLVVMAVASTLDYRYLERASTFFYFSALLILLLTLFFGSTVRGTSGWISFGLFQVQPVEFAKIALVLFLASFIRKKRTELGEWTRIIASFILSAAMMILVLRQPDLGSAFVLMMIWAVMIVVAGIRWKHFFVLGSLSILLAVGSYFLLAPYQKDRLSTFLHPELDPKGSGYNVLQAMVAVGSGGVFGKGLGSGSQSQLSFLPEKHTDFIFAVTSEELGLTGAWFILALYLVLLYRMKRIAELASDNLGFLLASGILALFVVHIVINIGMNLGVVPVTGLPAPFLSYGGSSLVASLLAVGVLQSIYRNRREHTNHLSLSLEKSFLEKGSLSS